MSYQNIVNIKLEKSAILIAKKVNNRKVNIYIY